jgi:hypothetical protein
MTRRSLFVLLLMLVVAGVARPTPTEAVQGIGADLFYVAPDASGVRQVFKVDGSNAISQLTTEAADVTAYDVAFNNSLAYVTGRALSFNGTAITAGGPLDSPALQLADVSWSPTAARVAVVARADAVDPSEGVWLYDINAQSWTLALTSTKSDPAATLIYTSVTWAESGDRLVLDVEFSPESSGVSVYSLSTGNNRVFNQDGTGGIIDPNGYGRGRLALDGTKLILSEVPGAPTGSGFIVDVNNISRIVPLVGPEYEARYLSHALPIRGGVAFFVRDFGNNIATTEVWQLSYTGARVALGSIPNADLSPDGDWTEAGDAVVYLNEFDETSRTGTPHVFMRVGEIMEEVTLPAEIGQVADPQWGPDLTATSFTSIVDITVTEPLFEFQDEAGTPYFSTRVQWNALDSVSQYQLRVVPGFDEQEAFTVQGVAARFNRMNCDVNYSITVAGIDAAGAPGAESEPVSVTMPPCASQVFPVMNDLYASAPPPAAPADGQPAAPAATEEAAPADAGAAAPPPVASDIELAPGVEQDGPATVTDLAVAGEPIQEGSAPDGNPMYGIDLTWSPPQQQVNFFLVNVSPPFGENQRDVLPLRAGEANPLAIHLTGLLCGVDYNFVVQSIAQDGTTSLSNSGQITASMPACP